jgi:hypothetical protein
MDMDGQYVTPISLQPSNRRIIALRSSLLESPISGKLPPLVLTKEAKLVRERSVYRKSHCAFRFYKSDHVSNNAVGEGLVGADSTTMFLAELDPK